MKNLLKTNTNEFKALFEVFIKESINMPENNISEFKEQLQWLYDDFIRVSIYPSNVENFNNNYIDMYADYLTGLPYGLDIPYENYKIIQLAISWNTLEKNPTEKRGYLITNNYWYFIAVHIFKLFEKYDIKGL